MLWRPNVHFSKWLIKQDELRRNQVILPAAGGCWNGQIIRFISSFTSRRLSVVNLGFYFLLFLFLHVRCISQTGWLNGGWPSGIDHEKELVEDRKPGGKINRRKKMCNSFIGFKCRSTTRVVRWQFLFTLNFNWNVIVFHVLGFLSQMKFGGLICCC